MSFKITIEQGRGKGQSFDFDAEEVTIGRGDDNDLVLAEPSISRRHVRIGVDGDRFVVSDLESAGGTFLNDTRIESELLENGDLIGVGNVKLRFESEATNSASPVEGATRIVSIAAAEKEAAAAKGSAAPAAGLKLTPKQIRLIAVAGGALLVLFAVGAMMGKGGDTGNACPAELPLKDGIAEYVFGNTEGDCDPGDTLTFAFPHTAKTRAILHYAPFYVDSKGELVIELNGTKIADVPAAPKRRSTLQTLVLPDGELNDGEKNVLVFRNTKGDVWGVERIEMETIALNEADLKKAQESYELATRKYRERAVAAPNLYQSWMYFREARRYMEGLEPKPDLYRATIALIRDAERDLDKLCKEQLFVAEQQAKYGNIVKANEAYKFVLASFPGNAHPCRAKAESNMYVEDKGE